MQDIHDLKPLMTMAFPWLSVLLFGMGVLIVLASVTWVVWRLWKRRRPAKTVPTPETVSQPPRQDPREQALKALRKLQPHAEQPEAFYLKLEHILRRYLSATHGEPLQSYTASELSQFFQKEWPRLDATTRNGLLQALQHGEQAKFARQSLTLQVQSADLNAIQHLITHHTDQETSRP